MAVAVAGWPFVGRRGELERIDDALADERSRAVVTEAMLMGMEPARAG